MTTLNPEENLSLRANFLKALGHPMRLLIVNLVAVKQRHGEELAAILGLNPATVSHHLSKLAEAGIVTSKKDQYYQTYSLEQGALKRSLDELVRLPQPDLKAQVELDAYRSKVVKTFFKHGRLKQIPAQHKKQAIILAEIAKEFEPEKQYQEIEINRVLIEFHEDVAWLRRSLVEHKFISRSRGIYTKIVSAESQPKS